MSERDIYYAAARTWADDRVSAAARHTRLAWIVAGVSGGVAFTLAIALALLVPLKTVEPYVVTVDRQSGAVQIATTLREGKLTQNEAVIQAQLAGYVRARETFDESDLRVQYAQVQRLSSPPVARGYVDAMAAANPASPLRTLGRGDTVAVDIKSVSLISPGVAMVRFDTRRSSLSGGQASVRSHVAAISFGFANAPLRLEDRFDNPLGFQVTRYRRDIEGVPQ
ncbi:type VI secretion protein [Polymorphobacter multimanifer]|uniref:Type IV secretion system protein VirB8 n=1 Tax=Polymorphobacter multimanifer TaxID=1070431 RepID=A0A841L9Z4_9SPHN|nr:VirB8/TrbF family protein [Polymorphobacter multimanifer]MBB6229250.1 type IV secretion system protein VirB8 [Polymorphobacter multimanifer]GGI85121.1 type VI secretion protein [Polymorphobacter multimanifer]